MASHKGWDRHYPVKSVQRSGGSFNLAKGQLALIDLDATPTNAGLQIIDDLTGKSKDSRYQLRIGKADIANNRSQSSKAWSSETFKIENVLDLKVDAPQGGIVTDEFILGYDGFDDATAITLINGENEEISINVCGEVIGAIGYQASEVEVKAYLTAPNSGTFTNHELVETAVEQLKAYKLMGDIPLSNYVEITPINSENAALSGIGVEKVFFNLVIADAGDSNALAAVQAQYNGFKVVRSGRDTFDSTYTVISDPQATITTGAFVVDQEYEIVNVGDTDFTLIGASANTVGVKFIATGVGGGTTGTAIEIFVSDFTVTKNWKVKGCAACPTGYSAFVDGYVYSVSLEDDGADSTAAIEGWTVSEEAGSVVKVSEIAGVSTYTVVLTAEPTDAENDAFLATNPEAVITLVTTNAADVCAPDNSLSYAWEAGESCRQDTVTYTMILADDECGVNRLTEVSAAYPGLSVTAGTNAQCQTEYSVDVITNIVCAECDDVYYDLFVSDAPDPFGVAYWKTAAKTYSATAKMGIRFKAKPIILTGSEVYRDDLPDFATSARIKVAGGAYTNVNESFFVGTNGRFAGRVLSIASEPENWGMNLREFEDISKRYEEGVSRHEGNNYGKWILGEETQLDGTQPYVDYIITIKLEKYAQSFSGQNQETFNYHFLVAPGAHTEVEAVLNAIAAKAEIATVQAYAKDA